VKRVFLSLCLCVLSVPVGAQMSHHHNRDDVPANTAVLIEQARRATEVFADRSVAIARGYRLVGRDLPMMGEHWLNVRLLVDGVVDVSRPQILTYLDIGGKPVLTGVVYAVALESGQSPPDLFGSDAMWHEHNGSIDDEALIPEHHANASQSTGTRVAFLHVWTRIPFNESIFAAENWALPFVRAGLPVPEQFPVPAARSVSLLSGGSDFYLDMIGSRRDSAAFARARVEVDSVMSGRTNRHLSDDDLVRLSDIWKRLLESVRASSGASAAERIK
jgi:hypothetical protein